MSVRRRVAARAGWFALALAAVLCVAAPVGALPAPLLALALAITWGVLPGARLARRFAVDQPRDARAAFALLVSPFVCGGVLAFARVMGVPPTLAAQGIAAVLALLAAGEALRPAAVHEPTPDTRPGWWLALAFGALVLLAHALHPALTEHSDGAFHAGVVRALERALPPEDPFFAGLPLLYAWGLHAWAAGWLALAPRLAPYTPLVWANAGAAIATLLAVAALARRLGASPRTTVLAQALALVGAAPFGWLVLAARAMRGDVRGAAELSKALDHGAEAAFRALDPGWLHPSLVLPLDKFVVLTPFAWALAGGAVALLAIAAWQDGRSRRALACLAFAVAAAVFAHPFAGVALMAVLLAGSLTRAIVQRESRVLAGTLIAFLCAIAPLVPYLLTLVGPYERFAAPLPDLRLAGVISALVGGAIVIPMSASALWALARRDGFATVMLTAILALVFLACTMAVAGDNQSKFLNLAFLLAAAPAAVGWSRRTPAVRRVATVALFLAVGPTLAAALWAYARESRASQDAPPRPPAEILAALERESPRDAIVVDATQDTTRGAAPALPGATGRALLWSGGFMARKVSHSRTTLLARVEAAHALATGGTFAGADLDLPRERELWLIVADSSARFLGARDRVVARAEGASLVRSGPAPR